MARLITMQTTRNMKRILLSLLLVSGFFLALTPARAGETAAAPANAARLKEWQDMRFGMFIHWGPVSLKGTEIGWSRGAQMPIEEYDNLYKQFNPVEFNADEWVAIAKAAGMKYMVFTTKHHDGFCMWDTKQTDYNIMNSPFGRDVVKELAEACRRAGHRLRHLLLGLRLASSRLPARQPRRQRRASRTPNLDRYEQYLRAQVQRTDHRTTARCSSCGSTCRRSSTRSAGRASSTCARSLQPDILVNNRCGGPRRLRHARAADRRVPDRPPVGNLHDHLPAVGVEARTTR